ncbi:MAG: ABC transporter substrate-binding protein [Candidatus Tokpelaia sp.]|nr:MAG: ABC transporter substrate-binding protein [Candidatus Tokpelaia sp.]KAA6205773.1 MAG: ABC transporter substrate-binding protein [Candidatus Tokpelaia sp.]
MNKAFRLRAGTGGKGRGHRRTALLAALVCVFSVGEGVNTAQAAPKSLIYCTSTAPAGFDVALYSDLYTSEASGQMIYQRLVAFAPGGTKIVPSLAESWDISPDGRLYTFHLRRGVAFQTTPYFKPSRAMNADDVVFSLTRQMDKTGPWYIYEPGQSYQYFDSMNMPNIIKAVTKLDDYTVQIELNRPEAPFLADMAMDFASILSKEYADKLAASGKKGDLNMKPVGTGAFILTTNQKSVAVRYRANPDYWGNKPKLDNIVFAIIDDGSVRVQKLKAGECDLVRSPPLNEMGALRAAGTIKVLEQPGLNLSFFAWNMTRPPFDKVAVRRALNMAVDRKAIASIIFYGEAEMAKNPLPPVGWGYNNAVPAPEYNPEKARKMLEQAGVKNLQFDISITPSGSLIANPKRLAEMLQSDFAKIGVKANVNMVEWTELLRLSRDKARNGLAMMGWAGDNGDPDNFLGMLFSCGAMDTVNNAFFCNADYDKLIMAARQNADIEARTQLYYQAQEILYREQPVLLMAYSPNTAALRRNIRGYHLDPVGLDFSTVDKD